MNLIAQFVFNAIVFGLPAMLIILHGLHFILPKKFDALWFNGKFFSDAELAIYANYPLSLVRTLAYASAIGLPSMVQKRFGDLTPAQQTSPFIKRLVFGLFFSIILVIVAGLLAIIIATTLGELD